MKYLQKIGSAGYIFVALLFFVCGFSLIVLAAVEIWSALFGDSHAHGADGVHFFTRGKVVTSRWLDPSHGGINLGFPQNH